MAIVYLGLGSNLGERQQALVAACTMLHQHPAITVQAVSALYHTAPVGMTEQDWFLNAVAQVQTTLSPQDLLAVTQATEQRLGRVPTVRWGPRVIDIDLLLYDTVQLQTPTLTLPHAALHARRFALIPLLELAPEAQLPSGVRLGDLLAALPDDGGVHLQGPFPAFMNGPRP